MARGYKDKNQRSEVTVGSAVAFGLGIDAGARFCINVGPGRIVRDTRRSRPDRSRQGVERRLLGSSPWDDEDEPCDTDASSR